MWIDINQNSDEWLDLRSGKVTGSSIGKVMANFGKSFGEPAKKLAVNLAVERITGKKIDGDNYTNAHMERGHEQEPIARALYEEMFFVDVTNGGFYDNGITGCSPDGLVLDNGVIEIKSVIPTTHYSNIKRKSYDPSYKWQYIFNLRESGREWIDFVSYCANYPKHNRLYVFRINQADIVEELDMIHNRLIEFEKYISSVIKEIGAAS